MSLADAPLRSADAACPGLFRIVPARDGGICRIKVPLGHLNAGQARAIADVAARRGSGIIDITNRANLQIRGIAPGQAPDVSEALVAAGLGPAHPEGDDIRNVMVSPTAGVDPGQAVDVRPLARTLLGHLQDNASCRALSPKFSFLVDGGEDVAVVDHPHDIWLASIDSERMAIGFAGCLPVAAEDPPASGVTRTEDIVDFVAAAVALFEDEAAGNSKITRLRHLFAMRSREDFAERLARRLGTRLARDIAISGWRRRAPRRLDHVGVGRQRGDGLSYVGAVPPLGRLSPVMLTEAAALAERDGSGNLHLTPWQSLLIPSIRSEQAAEVVVTLERLGFTCLASAPLASMIACAGSPGCSAGLSDTKADAWALAQRLSGASSRTVHLSGCMKSCASASVADVTLVATGSSAYDVYRKDGAASRFGIRIARDATIDEAAQSLNAKP